MEGWATDSLPVHCKDFGSWPFLPNVSSLKNPLEDLRKARFSEFPPERRPLTIETESVFVLVARTKCKLPGRARTCYGGMSNLAFRVYGLGAINLSYCYRTVYC